MLLIAERTVAKPALGSIEPFVVRVAEGRLWGRELQYGSRDSNDHFWHVPDLWMVETDDRKEASRRPRNAILQIELTA